MKILVLILSLFLFAQSANASGIAGKNDPRFSYEVALEALSKTVLPMPEAFLGKWMYVGSAKSPEALSRGGYGQYVDDGRYTLPSGPGYFQSWLKTEFVIDVFGNRLMVASTSVTGCETGQVQERFSTGPDVVQTGNRASFQISGSATKCLTKVECGILSATGQLLCASTTVDLRKECSAGETQPYVVQLFNKSP